LSAAAAVAVLLLDVVYIYGIRFRSFVHSDAAATVLVALGAIRGRLPIDFDWYVPNGDLWVFAPHIYAMPFVGLWGVRVETLLAALLVGFAVQMAALLWSYWRLGGGRYGALLGVALSLIAWSRLHVLFVYVELSYGFVATVYTLLFTSFALLSNEVCGTESKRASRRIATLWLTCALCVGIVALQNPTRAAVFVIAPMMVASVWPFRTIKRRSRLVAGVAPLAGVAAATVVRNYLLQSRISVATPTGHIDFEVRSLTDIGRNVIELGRGLRGLVGDVNSVGPGSVSGVLLLVLALVLVATHAFQREFSLLRIVCITCLAQLAAVSGPLLIGNLVVNSLSIRYLMPSLLLLLGLAAIVASQLIGKGASGPIRRIAIGYFGLAPLAAVLSTLAVVGPFRLEGQSDSGQFAHADEHQSLADALTQRGLRHGFATYWNAHLLTLLSRGFAKTCPIHFGGQLAPYRWNTDTWCFDATRLPDRIFVVASAMERASATAASAASMAPALERFEVGEFEVSVYGTKAMPEQWLAPPIVDGGEVRLPLQIEASHPQIRLGSQARLDGRRIVATGEEGTVCFGPYLDLPVGNYTLRWFGTFIGETKGGLGFDVRASKDGSMLSERSIDTKSLDRSVGNRLLVELHFSLARTTTGIEFRVFSRGGARVALERIEVSR